MIHVCYGLYDKDGRYSKFTATSMLSLFENTPPPTQSVIVHILHDNTLTQENRDKFIYIAGRYGQIIKFYNVEILCKDLIAGIKKIFAKQLETSVFTVAMFYRLFVTTLIAPEIKKIIYLDSDTIINLDIQELWQVKLGDKVLAAVTEKDNSGLIQDLSLCLDGFVNYENYFNSGVLILNLKVLRNERKSIEKGINFIASNPRYTWCDQDILNYCFSEKYLKLPVKFNQFVRSERFNGKNTIDEKIYHYAGQSLQLNPSDNFNQLWLKYFVKTPFFNENSFINLYGGIQQLHIQQKKFAVKVSEIMSGKKRAFFIVPSDVATLKNTFQIKSDEDIILADSPQSLQKLADEIKNAKGKKVFFIAIREFLAVYQSLTRAGFTYGKDFVNAFEFLSDAEGLPLNSHFLVKLL